MLAVVRVVAVVVTAGLVVVGLEVVLVVAVSVVGSTTVAKKEISVAAKLALHLNAIMLCMFNFITM